MGAGVRAGRGEGGEWRGPRGWLRCVPEAAKHNFPPLLPPGPGSCCRPRRHRPCYCYSSRCCSSPGSVVGESRWPARAKGGATEGLGAASGRRLSQAARRLSSAVGCASECHGLWLETFRRARGEAKEGPGLASAAPAARPASPLPGGRAASRLMARVPRWCLRHGLLRLCSGTVTSSLIGAGSLGHGLLGWG